VEFVWQWMKEKTHFAWQWMEETTHVAWRWMEETTHETAAHDDVSSVDLN
jgi:hypothetical protein